MANRYDEIVNDLSRETRETLRQVARDRQLSPTGNKDTLTIRLADSFYSEELDKAEASRQMNELAQANAAEAARPTIVVVVLGSYAWESKTFVSEVLINWWVAAGQPNVNLVTGGSPAGAEAFAREVAENHNWSVTTMRDEEISGLPAYIGYGFIRDNSEIEGIIQGLSASAWWRVFRDETSRVVSRWASR